MEQLDGQLKVTCSAASGRSDFNHPREAFLYPFLINKKKNQYERKSERHFLLLLQEVVVKEIAKSNFWEDEKEFLETDGGEG